MSAMMSQALSYLAQGGWSAHKLSLKLRQEFAKEPNLEPQIKETFSYLTQRQFINDARVAQRIAEHYAHKGDSVVSHHLREAGIDAHQTKLALSYIGNEYQRAYKEAKQKYSDYEGEDLKELQNQIMRLLCSRSFCYQTLTLVMEALFPKNNQLVERKFK